MNSICAGPVCPIILDSTCVFYSGANLIYTGINTNDNLQAMLVKIDNKFRDAGLGYVFQNGLVQIAPGSPVGIGGSLTQNTTINSAGFTFTVTEDIIARAHITSGGTSSQFVKGDGSLDSTVYQTAGNYITGLTGDGTATGPGVAPFTLATVNPSPGTWGSATKVPILTIDGKGRITNNTETTIFIPSNSLSFVGDVTGLGTTGSPVTLTLNTVNANVYGTNTPLKFAVNGKGLVTSAAPIIASDVYAILGFVPIGDAPVDSNIYGRRNASWVVVPSSGPVTTPTLQQVVNTGNGISNFGGVGNANIQSTNFTNGRTLLLNDNSAPAIKIVDNANASNYLQIDVDTLNIDGTSYNWSTIVNPPTGTLVALPFTTDHLATTNNQYVVGDVVYYVGNVYRCIANNDSLQPNLSPLYWTLLGAGFPLVQQPSDWNSTSGNNQILNKPTIPIVGTWGALNYPTWTAGTPFVKMTAVGTFALDTTTYQPLLTNPVTGTGTTNYIPKWSSSSALGDSQIRDDGSSLAVGISPDPNFKFVIASATFDNTLRVSASNPSGAGTTAGTFQSLGNGTGPNKGLFVTSANNTNYNVGIHVVASTTSPYAIWLQDGTEGIGKVLTSTTNDGKAQWVTPATPSIGFEMNFLLMGA